MLWKLNNISLKGEEHLRLNEVSLTVESGITAVMGHSGAGKTSLLNLLVGFEKPDQGELENNIGAQDHALPIFWVPSNFGLWPHLTVAEHIQTVLPDKGIDGDGILAKFAIADKKAAYPAQLSCGECSRLAMARALAADPAVLVMDEPLLNVDPARKLYFWDVIVNQAAQQKISLVYVSHSPRYVTGFAENIICLQDGKIAYADSVNELYHNPPSEELAEFLGEINWFGDDEKVFSEQRSLRPEQVQIKPDASGKLEVVRTRFMGEIAETELADTNSGKTKIIFHRPAGNDLKVGEMVNCGVTKRY